MAMRQYEIEQEYGQVESNILMLDEQAMKQIVEVLNQDLASLYVLHHQYHKHHWIVEGAHFLELHLLLEEHYTELHTQFDEVAERIVALGGLPVTAPAEIERHAYIQHEPEGMFDLREMLEHDVEMESTIAEQMREHIATANRLGDFGSETLLKTSLEATEKRAAFLEKHLIRESLSKRIPAE